MSLLSHFGKHPEPQKPRLPRVLHAMEMLLIDQKGADLDRDCGLDWEYEHMHNAAKYAKMLAAHRKLDPDLAACAAAAQNIGRLTTGRTEGHAEAGYESARRLFLGLGCFTPAEVEQLSMAVKNHSRKDRVDSKLDELEKDVDIYVRYVHGIQFTASHELRRLSAIKLELQTRINT